MFSYLLEGIFDACGAESQEEQEKYLFSLQKDAEKLWESYRDQEVSVHYRRKEIQDSYLLRYYPFYRKLLPEVLCSLPWRTTSSSKLGVLQATFFGCGPAPELLGLCSFIYNNGVRPNRIIANLIDIATKDWLHATNLSLGYVNKMCAPYWPVDTRQIQADISNKMLIDSTRDVYKCVTLSNLIVYQNCLNEIAYKDIETTIYNIKQLLIIAPIGSVTIIIERCGYGATKSILNRLLYWATDAPEIQLIGPTELTEQHSDCGRILDKVPNIVTNNLFRRNSSPESESWLLKGLIFSEKIKYISLAFQRKTLGIKNKTNTSQCRSFLLYKEASDYAKQLADRMDKPTTIRQNGNEWVVSVCSDEDVPF